MGTEQTRTASKPATVTIVLLALPLLLCAATALPAQTVRGRLLDAGSEEPIAAANVLLLNHRGEPVARTFTNSAGAFVLTAPRGGRYRLRARRIGYKQVTSPAIDLLPEDTLTVELRLSSEAVPLAPLTVTAERPPRVLNPRLAREGYYARKEIYGKEEGMGFAYFFDEEELDRMILFDATDIVQNLPGIDIQFTGDWRVGHRVRLDCRGYGTKRPSLYLNGHPLPDGMPLNILIEPNDLVAVEVYPSHLVGSEYGACSIVMWTG